MMEENPNAAQLHNILKMGERVRKEEGKLEAAYRVPGNIFSVLWLDFRARRLERRRRKIDRLISCLAEREVVE
jgi:hypothetical protein